MKHHSQVLPLTFYVAFSFAAKTCFSGVSCLVIYSFWWDWCLAPLAWAWTCTQFDLICLLGWEGWKSLDGHILFSSLLVPLLFFAPTILPPPLCLAAVLKGWYVKNGFSLMGPLWVSIILSSKSLNSQNARGHRSIWGEKTPWWCARFIRPMCAPG